MIVALQTTAPVLACPLISRPKKARSVVAAIELKSYVTRAIISHVRLCFGFLLLGIPWPALTLSLSFQARRVCEVTGAFSSKKEGGETRRRLWSLGKLGQLYLLQNPLSSLPLEAGIDAKITRAHLGAPKCDRAGFHSGQNS